MHKIRLVPHGLKGLELLVDDWAAHPAGAQQRRGKRQHRWLAVRQRLVQRDRVHPTGRLAGADLCPALGAGGHRRATSAGGGADRGDQLVADLDRALAGGALAGDLHHRHREPRARRGQVDLCDVEALQLTARRAVAGGLVGLHVDPLGSKRAEGLGGLGFGEPELGAGPLDQGVGRPGQAERVAAATHRQLALRRKNRQLRHIRNQAAEGSIGDRPGWAACGTAGAGATGGQQLRRTQHAAGQGCPAKQVPT